MIYGKNINLWAIERPDLVQNYSWGNDPELVKLTGITPLPRSGWEIERWYESIQGNPNTFVFSIKLNDSIYIGNVEITNLDWRNRKGEIGVMIGDKKSRGKGYGTEAILLMCRFGFEEMNLHKIYARILAYNDRAIKTFEKCGFKKEGIERDGYYVGGEYRDIITYGILKGEFREMDKGN